MRENYLALIRGERAGWRAGLAKVGLGAIAIPYGWGVRLRNAGFDFGWSSVAKAEVPVVSVGNLTLGGTGKTPCVEYLARWFRRHDVAATILSRGYGSETGRNDEALVLEANCPDVPHLQGADRAALAKIAVEELEAELLILDDGFQHRRLGRDLDVVLVDATCPWGFGRLFPRGLLREPRSSLRRADVVMITRRGLVGQETIAEIRRDIERFAPDAAIVESDHRPAGWINARGDEKPVDAFHGRPVAGFCGIGNPSAFRKTLEDMGCHVTAWRTFPDHHGYRREDVDDLRDWARRLPEGTTLATTQKDLVKLRLDSLGGRELWALKIELAILAGEDRLDRALSAVMSGRRESIETTAD